VAVIGNPLGLGVTAMAEGDKAKFDIPWATLLPLVAALAGIIAQYKPLVSSRPTAPAEKPLEIVAEQNVDARLWQDPIAVAEKQKASLDSDIEAQRALPDVVNSHDIGALAELLEHADSFPNDPKDVSEHKPLLLLAVMLEAGPYSEQGEARLRTRQAVLEGLSESGFVPKDAEHIGFVTASWPPGGTGSGSSATIKRALLLPWEECDATERTRSSGVKRVFVLWLPAMSFTPDPLRRFAVIIDQLVEHIRDKIDVKLIGPANSAGLIDMIREVRETHEGETRDGLNDATQKALQGVTVISPLATASDEALLYDPSSAPSASDVPPSSPNESVKNLLERRCHGLRFFRTIATDDTLLCKLIEELKLRRVRVDSKIQDASDASAANVDHVVILSEWDTPYGRSLGTTFAAKASHQTFTEITNDRTKRPRWIYSYRYLRGIDGQLPGGASKDSSREQPQKNQLGQEIVAIEATEGLNQSDYLRRLARELKGINANLQRKYGSGIRAIGLLGSDVYDKLMILRALRPEFPDAVFFTNNYDARLERRDDWGDVHNLIIASPFGNRLPWTIYNKQNDQHVAPFRDGNQTSMYLGTLVATGRIQYKNAEDLSQHPRVFEISRRGAFDLSTKFKNTWFRDWLYSDHVALNLLFGTLFLALMIAWVSVNIANRRLPGGGTTAQRLKRVVSSTAFWLVCGTPVIVFFVTAFAQSEWAAQEPFLFFSGISTWPSEMLRLVALMLAIHFMIKAGIDLRANERELEERFCLDPLPPTRFSWRHLGLGLDPWRRYTKGGEPESEFSAQEAWHAYLRRNKFWPRFIRIGILFTMYFMFSVALFHLFTQRPVVPARGELAFNFDTAALLLGVFGLLILSFYVVDAIQLNSNFIRMFAREVTRWGRGVVERSHRSPPLSEEELSAYNEIFFVAQRTEVVARLIWYPLIVLTLMVVARCSIFANWTWPLSLVLIYALNATWALGSAILLRRAAEQLREAALSNLQLLRVISHAVEEKRKMFDELIAEIRALKKGAFAPLTEQHFIRAILVPSGGLGLLAVGQRLLDIF
jgi:hypothetical protein